MRKAGESEWDFYKEGRKAGMGVSFRRQGGGDAGSMGKAGFQEWVSFEEGSDGTVIRRESNWFVAELVKDMKENT